MKKLLQVSTFVIVLSLVAGFWMQSNQHPLSEKVIGVSVLLILFYLLPLFLYYRYKNKRMEDYILTKEKMDHYIKKMKE